MASCGEVGRRTRAAGLRELREGERERERERAERERECVCVCLRVCVCRTCQSRTEWTYLQDGFRDLMVHFVALAIILKSQRALAHNFFLFSFTLL